MKIPHIIVKTPINCSLCGKEYETYVIDGHITYPHICNDCLQSMLKEIDKMREKCKNCAIYKEVEKSPEPACCIWYMDNVILGNKIVNECTDYKPIAN